jgi:competence protein ComEC
MLLPGDVQNRQEADLVRFWGRQLDSNWLLAAHHGSKTSSSPAFLKWVQPDTAVISAGYANPFGHPHSRVIQRLQKKNITIYSTASDGALEFEVVPGQALAVRAYRKRVRRYWM